MYIRGKTLFKEGNIKSLRYDKSKRGIVLYDSRVVTDDSPGFGFPYGREILESNISIKKELSSYTSTTLNPHHQAVKQRSDSNSKVKR